MEPIARVTARVVPVCSTGEVLLLQEQDPARPGQLYWGTIGGAVDASESLQAAAVRELREETGIVAEIGDLTEPFHRGRRAYSYAGVSYVGEATFFGLVLDRDTEISFAHLEPEEVGNVLDARWWTPHDLAADGRLVAPDLCDIMTAAVRAVRAGQVEQGGAQ